MIMLVNSFAPLKAFSSITVVPLEEVERYIVCYLMAKSEHDDSKLYWQMVDKSQLNEETETIIKNQS